MKARLGDRLVLAGTPDRYGVVIAVLGEDGAPPYVVRWRSDDRVAMVFPDRYARIVPAGHPAGTGLEPGTDR
jgi:Domain of unknown function (DUF1918)